MLSAVLSEFTFLTCIQSPSSFENSSPWAVNEKFLSIISIKPVNFPLILEGQLQKCNAWGNVIVPESFETTYSTCDGTKHNDTGNALFSLIQLTQSSTHRMHAKRFLALEVLILSSICCHHLYHTCS